MTGMLILLADSQLLFPGRKSAALLRLLKARLSGKRGIYIGAANGNEPVFHELAREAFSAFGASLEMQPGASVSLDTRADFYVLAGGDVELGWKYFSQPEILQSLNDARAQNAVFIGVSAGAMHLSGAVMPLCETTKLGEENVHALPELQRYLNWVNLAVAVHEESQNWPTLENWRRNLCHQTALALIPLGGALVVTGNGVWQTGNPVQWHSANGEYRVPALPESDFE